MELLKATIRPKPETEAWLENHTKLITSSKYKKPIRTCEYWINLKLYFGTDDIRIYWNRSSVSIQVRDEEPEHMKKSEFTEKYVKPAALYFSPDFSRVHGTQKMLDKFFAYCKETFDDNLT